MSEVRRKRAKSGSGRTVMALVAALLLLPSCSENKPATQPSSWNDQARQDPYNFSPKMNKTDISGGDIGHFDRDAMKRDLDHVLNP